MRAIPKNEIVKIPAGIWALGFVSMLMDISSEMIHSLLPIYLVGVMGASNTFVGLIEGISEATAAFVKTFSGIVSDWIRKRKLLLLLGYGLACFTKPIFPLAESINAIFTARFIDRIGKGIRVAPRDALIADITPPEIRGASFGLRQSLDSIGAFLGPIFAIIIMFLCGQNFKTVFWIAFIPAFVAILIIFFFVKDKETIKREGATKFGFASFSRFPPIFFIFLFLTFIMGMAHFSEAFLVLRANDLGLKAAYVPLVFVIMNLSYSVFAYRAGILADKIAREKILIISLLFLVIADLILGFTQGLGMFFLGTIIWGLYLAFSQGVLSAMVADFAPKEILGTAFGILNLVNGIALIFSGILAGMISDRFGFAEMFATSAVIACCAIAFLFVFPKLKPK